MIEFDVFETYNELQDNDSEGNSYSNETGSGQGFFINTDEWIGRHLFTHHINFHLGTGIND